MKPCKICGRPGQRHHIIHKSRGGLDIELNYISLCLTHHTDGKDAIHNNRKFELSIKRELQKVYFNLFPNEKYTTCEIAEMIGHKEQKLEKAMKSVPNIAGIYKQEDIIRFLMGGKLY